MVSINWPSKIINVDQSDLTLVSGNVYELNVNTFRLLLKNLEDDEGMPFPDTHQHTPTTTLGGVTLARSVEIINGYTITFEDGQYAVNLVGGNSNIADITNVNQVSIRSANSAGLVQVSSGSGLSSEQASQLGVLFAALESSGVFSAAALANAPAGGGGGGGADAASIYSYFTTSNRENAFKADLSDIPTVAEFNARTLPADDYFVVGDYKAPDDTAVLVAIAGLPSQAFIQPLLDRLTAARAGYLDKLNVAGTLANTSNAQSFIGFGTSDRTNLTQIETAAEIARKGVTNRYLIDAISKTGTLFDDNGMTPLVIKDLKDAAGNPSSEQVYESDPQ